MQCLVFLVTGLPPNDSERDGLFFNHSPRTICSSIPRLYDCDGFELLARRPLATTWTGDHGPKLHRWHWLHPACYMHGSGSEISWHISRRLCISCHCKYLTLGCQQSRIRLPTRDGVSRGETSKTIRIEADRIQYCPTECRWSMWTTAWHQDIS